MAKRIIVCIIIVFSALYVSAQKYGIGGSFDLLNPVMSKKFLPGVAVFFDVPRTKAVALYGKVAYYFPTSIKDSSSAYVIAIDPMTNPYQQSAITKTVISTFSIQGGSKYFVGNDYNVGFSGQFDTHVKLLISPYKSLLTGYDASMYHPDPQQQITSGKGVSFTLYAGASAGIKYSQPWGTVFASLGGDILLFYYRYTPITSKFLVNFEIGYRRDLY
jgi:hypothetical protein